jgi:hypothetical protein
MKANLGMDISKIVIQTIEGIIAQNNGETLEQINDELIIKGLELGFLDLLVKQYNDLTPFLLENFDYNSKKELYYISEKKKFSTHIPDQLRIKYYLTSFLQRMEIENRAAGFDEIVRYVLPLLKNGHVPEEQTVLKVLEQIADQTGGGWRIKQEERDLFGFSDLD